MGVRFMCCRFQSYHIGRVLPSQSTSTLYFQKKHSHRRENIDKYEPKDKIMHYILVSLQVVDHLLLGNEMRGLVDQRHERVEFV